MCAFLFARAEVYTPACVPSPKAQGQKYWVSNPDMVLSLEMVQQLNELCARLNTNTDVELAIVAIDRYDANQYDAYDFALRLFDHWGIGSEDRNTGVLLFLARSNRDVQIITGKGIEGILTDAKCGNLLDNNLSYFSAGDFDNGMLALCAEMEEFLMEDKNRSELMLGWAPKETTLVDFMMGCVFFGCVIIILMAWYRYKHPRRKPKQPKNITKQNNSQSLQSPLSFGGNSDFDNNRSGSWGGGHSSGGGAGRKF